MATRPPSKSSAKPPTDALWSKSVGFLPHKVTVYEEPARDGTLYLRWRAEGNWRKQSLRRALRTPRGKIDPEVQRWAVQQAEAKFRALVAGLAPAEQRVARPLTIAETLAIVTAPATGKYPTDTPHRREVERALDAAVRWWGAETSWAAIRRAHLRTLWRGRIQELAGAGRTGVRGAEVTVARVLAVAQWLRDEELIPADACIAARTWKQDLKADWLQLRGALALPEPNRPRHTLEEMRRILEAADAGDPRFALLMALGAELRLGQVVRCRRSDLDLEHRTLTVRTRGRNKKGVVVKLTAGQMAAVARALDPATGYLRTLEGHVPDYPLFPAGQMPGGRKGAPVATVARHVNAKPLNRSWIRERFAAAQTAAKVAPIPGRGLYGLRRAAVDAVKALRISREALKEHGGWSDTQVPDKIYADQAADYAREEAREVRAKIRGEALGELPAPPDEDASEEPTA